MERRNFLVSILLWIVAFFSGYIFKIGGENKVDKNEISASEKIGNLLDLGPHPRSLTNSLDDIWINIKNYGAKGDGKADDTGVIQNLLNTLPRNSVLFFPSGTYKITKRLTWNGTISLIGQSRENTIIKAFSPISDKTLLYKKEEDSGQCGEIKNLTFDGDMLVDFVFDFPKGRGLRANHNYFKNGKKRAVRFGIAKSWGAYEVYFYDNDIYGVEEKFPATLLPDYALEIGGYCSDSQFFRNIVINAKKAGILSAGGHNVINNNHIYGWPNAYIMKYCIEIASNTNNYLHNRCDTPLLAGLYLNNVWGNRIESNIITWNKTITDLVGKCGIRIDNNNPVQSVSKTSICNNFIEGFGTAIPPNDIILNGKMPRNSVIKGNYGNMASCFEKVNFMKLIKVSTTDTSKTVTFTNAFDELEYLINATPAWDAGGIKINRDLKGFTIHWENNPTYNSEIYVTITPL